MSNLEKLFEKSPEHKKAYDGWIKEERGNSWNCGCGCCFLTQCKAILGLEVPKEFLLSAF